MWAIGGTAVSAGGWSSADGPRLGKSWRDARVAIGLGALPAQQLVAACGALARYLAHQRFLLHHISNVRDMHRVEVPLPSLVLLGDVDPAGARLGAAERVEYVLGVASHTELGAIGERNLSWQRSPPWIERPIRKGSVASGVATLGP